MKEIQEKLLEEIKINLKITGNKIVEKLFFDFSNDENILYEKLREYNSFLYLNVNEEESDEEESDENDKGKYIHYIYFCNHLIDYRNISKIELCEEYNIKKNKMEYIINFYKKFISPNEENFCIIFSSEEERDKEFDVLRGKLKMCNINIL